MGAIFLGMAADIAYSFSHYDPQGAHLGPAALIGALVGIGSYYLSSANEPS